MNESTNESMNETMNSASGKMMDQGSAGNLGKDEMNAFVAQVQDTAVMAAKAAKQVQQEVPPCVDNMASQRSELQ